MAMPCEKYQIRQISITHLYIRSRSGQPIGI